MGAAQYFKYHAMKSNFCAYLIILPYLLKEDGVHGPIRKKLFQNGFLVNRNCQSTGCGPQSEGGRAQFAWRNRER